jgi:hypothetical protein
MWSGAIKMLLREKMQFLFLNIIMIAIIKVTSTDNVGTHLKTRKATCPILMALKFHS